MIIAITGSSGYIGKMLLKKILQTDHQVRVLSRKPMLKNNLYTSYIGDLTDSKVDLSSFLDEVDILYHCAGEINNEMLMNQLHVDGTKMLLSQSQGKVARWVQLSSVGAYGQCRNEEVTEKSSEQPSSIYEVSKTISDNLVIDSGIPYSILRPSNIFGKGMVNQSLYGLIKIIKKGVFFFIGKSGALLNYILSLIHI